MPSRGGNYQPAAGGSSVVEVSRIWTPSAGTPTSIGDGGALLGGPGPYTNLTLPTTYPV